MVFTLARPPVDQNQNVVREWKNHPENALLWSSGEGVFGVFLSSSRSKLARVLVDQSFRVETLVLEVECGEDSIPVFFDYELAWVRANGLPGITSGYPRSIPHPSASSGERNPALPSSAQKAGLRTLLEEGGQAPRLPSVGFHLLRRGLEEKSQRMGWVAFRSILNPMAVAASVTGFPGWCSFAHGALLPSAQPLDLFRALAGPASVSPFLFASDGEQVLLGVLSMGPGTRAPIERVSVTKTLERYLHAISVVQWPLGTTRIVTDHEYGRAIGLR
jgi:hypothetical protein